VPNPIASLHQQAIAFGLRYFNTHCGQPVDERGLKYTTLVDIIALGSAPGEKAPDMKASRRLLQRIGKGEICALWRARQRCAAEHQQQQAARVPPNPAPQPPAPQADDGGDLYHGLLAKGASSDTPEAKQARKALRKAARAVCDGNLGAGYAAFSESPVVHRSAAGATGAVEALHPQSATAAEYAAGVAAAKARLEARGGSLPVPTRLTVPSDVLRATVKALPKGRAAGLSIGTFETIQSIYHHDGAELLTGVVERLLNGEASAAARSFLTAAKLVALRKPNGKIRPIAVGDALRRLAMQVICRMRKESFDMYFTSPLLDVLPASGGGGSGGGGGGAGGAGGGGGGGGGVGAGGGRGGTGGGVGGGSGGGGAGCRANPNPNPNPNPNRDEGMQARLEAAGIALQLGVGTSGGTEIAAHVIRTHLENNPTDAAFKNDFKNAFNAMSRRKLVELLLLSPFADLEPAVRFFYEHAGLLYFDGERLGADSCEGCQQGDPLGPFLFALAFHATLCQVAREFTDCTFVAYLDDVTVLGPPARALAALQRLQQLAADDCDLLSEMSKCAVYSPSGNLDCVPAEVDGSPHHEGGCLDGMIFAGTPLGSDAYVVATVREKFKSLAVGLDMLAAVHDFRGMGSAAQVRLLLLQFCANPQVGFWLRVVPPPLIEQAALEFDAAVGRCLGSSLRATMHSEEWERALRQAGLPPRMGGLGLTRCTRTRHAAWVGSWALCWARMQQLVPKLRLVHLATSRLRCHVALRDSHDLLTALHSSVVADLRGIDAARAHPARISTGATLAYHPGGLPPADKLPSIAEMANPMCLLNKHAQRNLAQVIHLADWLQLMATLAGINHAPRRLREMSRFIGVSQPLAGAFLRAVPASDKFRVRSNEFNIIVERRLGLPCAALRYLPSDGGADQLGDAALKGCEHTTRHNMVVAAWLFAITCARGSAHTRAPTIEPSYSRGANPDAVNEFGGRDGGHELFEVKVYSSIVADTARLRRGATEAFGATESFLRTEILGDRAGTAAKPLLPKRGGGARTAKYQHALDSGHTVTCLISEVWGGFAPEAVVCLRRLAESRAGLLTGELAWATWATRGFMSYHAQRLSLQLHLGVAREIWRAATSGSASCDAAARLAEAA
jgi:hypothetical protein